MAAKLLHSLADDSPDLQKQIGCMTGIFQLFDRHHILTARRINQKRLPPANCGNSDFGDGILENDSSKASQRQTASDVSSNKGIGEKQRISTESSRASFSSSCSSSLSSLDCRAQVEASFDRIIYPETPSREPIMNQTAASPHLGLQSLDLRDVVKDSMYREARGLSVKKAIAEEEAVFNAMKHRDSPRPLQLSRSVDGSCGVGIDGKQSVRADVKESLRVLAKLREAPWNYGEAREIPRSSSEVKDGDWHLISKDAPRFSYDGREIGRLSFESRDTIKGPAKLKELPRLSLDSREGSWCTYSSDSKPNHLSRGLGSGKSASDDKMCSLPQSAATQRRPPSVVAKLMGLEALPDSHLVVDTPFSLSGDLSGQHDTQSPKLSKTGLIKPLKVLNSPKSSLKDPTSPRRKNPDLVMKPISSSRLPIEPAPWKQQDGNRSLQKSSMKALKAPARTPDSFPSVYSDFERRLKDLEFKQSGRDLRALKQILEAMQAKGFLETREEEQAVDVGGQRDNGTNSVSLIQSSRSARQQNPHGNNFLSPSRRVADSARACESPIVVMKPARLIEKTGISTSSVIPVGGLSGFHKVDSVANEDKKRISPSSRTSKGHSSKNSRRDTTASSYDGKAGCSKTLKPTQSQPTSQQFSKENSSSSINSGSLSPRMQQKKQEVERRSCPQTPPSDPNKARRKYSKHARDSGSPGGKLRPKSPYLQHSDNPLGLIRNETRTSSCQKDEVFVESDSITASPLNMDMEISSSIQSSQNNGSQSPSMKTTTQSISGSMQEKSIPRLDEDESAADIAINSQEHPSPVSVLDGSVYRDDEPSPVRQIADTPKADGAQEYKGNENEDWWTPVDKLVYSAGSGEIDRKKLQSIDHLVQKLRRVNSSHDESRIDYIASLCENTNPDQRYISEILLASGLLLRDLSSELLTFQLHPSGHPINPELFSVLEQTKASSFVPKEECGTGKVVCLELNAEKFHRKLIFDAVNEILGLKLALVSSSPEPWVKPSRLTKKTLSAQKLLKELCFEIEKMQFRKPESTLEDEEHGLRSILWEDVMHGSEIWLDFHDEISGVVLDVERLIFKDLVDEIVIGEAAGLLIKSSRRRKLFGM
ncbi:protein LONGIFOLIA 1 isoform X2 [Prosopis cineraria]|uniref:protein LONGIFOLIA 1 isoform X2 n=1 Tax=Prosopis cineraria TaxID=364024 RepID=UPI0024100575|nr:protein LONGIFOLIA 1 isoform X2 [Prosopis cineraria]